MKAWFKLLFGWFGMKELPIHPTVEPNSLRLGSCPHESKLLL